jgi:HD-GYP domain-containing protein (c-di-GMP phosphodiesterase class II)
MTRAGVVPFIRALRRAVTYARLYGSQHRLTLEACDEASKATGVLIGSNSGADLGIVGDTLFVDGAAEGEASLRFNGFIRTTVQAGVQSITLIGRVDADELAGLVRMIAGETDGYAGGTTVRINEIDMTEEEVEETPTSQFRRTYTQSLDSLRAVGVALQSGAPVSLEATATSVRDLIRQGMEAPRASILLATVKSHHEYTFYHSVNTSILSLAIAELIGLPREEQLLLGIGAMLHDIGKIGVSAAVLNHPGRLDEAQWAEIRRHPQIGAEAILAAAGPGEEVAAAVALEHHARFDGSGYPRLVYHDGTHHHHHHEGGHGHPLHFFSRLVAVADTYDAITTRRAYRRAEPPSRAMQILVNESGASYDPDFVLAFAHLLGVHPPGTFLRLRSGIIVMVVGGKAKGGLAPKAVIVRDASGADVAQPEPVHFMPDDIVEHVSASVLNASPTAILDKTGIAI